MDYSAISTALSTGIGSMVTETIEMATALIPTILNLVGIMFVVRWGMKFFKATSTKG